MTTRNQPNRTPLLETPNETDRSILSHVGIPLRQNAKRVWYYPKLSAIAKKRLHADSLRMKFGGSSQYDDIDKERAQASLDSLKVEVSWSVLLDVILILFGEVEVEPPSAMTKTVEPVTPTSKSGQVSDSAWNTFLKARAVNFISFQRYTGGQFSESQERVLFEHFLMLWNHYCRERNNKEFYHTLTRISADTGVAIHSLTRFINKVRDMGILHVELKGIPAQNFYRVDEAKLRASMKDIYKTSSDNSTDG